MIALVSRSLRLTTLPHLSLPLPLFSTLKKIRDTDELTTQELQDVLGRSLQQPKQQPIKMSSTQQKQQKGITERDSTFYYGLMPLKNENYPECIDPDQVVLQETPNQNIFKALQLAQNCSFDEYTLALNKFRTETDLYGSQTPKPILENSSLQFKSILHPQSPQLQRARKYHMVNISIPGTIECEDPRNFMSLRPIEQFRHTPLIPISQSYMQKHKEMLQRYHRKQFIFEVSTEKVINWGLIAACMGVGGYLGYLVLQKEEERTVSFSRLKYQRLVGQQSDKPVFRI